MVSTGDNFCFNEGIGEVEGGMCDDFVNERMDEKCVRDEGPKEGDRRQMTLAS